MNGTPPITSEQLAAFVSGEADAALRAAVDAWAAETPANAAELAAMLQAWQWTADVPEMPPTDIDAAWDKVLARAEAPPQRGRVVPLRPTFRYSRWLAVAAMVAGVFFAARILIGEKPREYTASVQALTTHLTDSSTVVLSPHSGLTAEIGRHRRVSLSGQAYFEVKRDTARTFTVEAGEVVVTVLGTGFEVSAYDTSRTVRVTVRHGHVRVEAKGNGTDLYAGEAASYDRASGRLTRMELPSSVVWGDRILQFKEAPMDEVVQRLEHMYDVEIRLGDPGIGHCLLTADFDNEPIDRILGVIADTFGLTLGSSGAGHYIFTGHGC